jgi:hypothetical protein
MRAEPVRAEETLTCAQYFFRADDEFERGEARALFPWERRAGAAQARLERAREQMLLVYILHLRETLKIDMSTRAPKQAGAHTLRIAIAASAVCEESISRNLWGIVSKAEGVDEMMPTSSTTSSCT